MLTEIFPLLRVFHYFEGTFSREGHFAHSGAVHYFAGFHYFAVHYYKVLLYLLCYLGWKNKENNLTLSAPPGDEFMH